MRFARLAWLFIALLFVGCQGGDFRGGTEVERTAAEPDSKDGDQLQADHDGSSQGDQDREDKNVMDAGREGDLGDNEDESEDREDEFDTSANNEDPFVADPSNVGGTNSNNDTGKIIGDVLKNIGMPSVLPSQVAGPGGDTPLVLDGNKDGKVSTLLAHKGQHVFFDINGDGLNELTEWVAPGDWLLVWDRNKDGVINSGKELFGDATAEAKANGFAVLATLDDNRDGVVDAADKTFAQLQVWDDRNGNGRTDRGELKHLKEAGVTSLNVQYENIHAQLPFSASFIGQVGSYNTVEGPGLIVDVYFRTHEKKFVAALGGAQ